MICTICFSLAEVCNCEEILEDTIDDDDIDWGDDEYVWGYDGDAL